MTNQFDQLLADFSDGASDVIDALVASTTGVRSPSLSVRGDGQQARQANAGSLVRLTDGTYHVIAFTNGVQVRADAVCLRLKPLAGGQAKDFYPAELAEAVDWIAQGCLSNRANFSSDGLNKQGACRAAPERRSTLEATGWGRLRGASVSLGTLLLQ